MIVLNRGEDLPEGGEACHSSRCGSTLESQPMCEQAPHAKRLGGTWHRGSSLDLLIELREGSLEAFSHLSRDQFKEAGRGLAAITLGGCRVLGHESLPEESEVASKVEQSIRALLEAVGEHVVIMALPGRDLGQAIGIAHNAESSGFTAVKGADLLSIVDQINSRLKKSLEVAELERTEAIDHVNLNLLRFPMLLE
jgi:hypothetical protein